MFDLILFGSIALLLLILVGFLIIVIRDHMRSKSFELYVKQTEEELEKAHETGNFQSLRRNKASEKSVTESPGRESPATAAKVGATPSVPGQSANTVRETSGSESPQKPVRRNTQSEKAKASTPPQEERPTVYPFHPKAEAQVSEAREEAQRILSRDFGHFDHQRLVEGMGLSPEEADEFVLELIGQLENAIPELDGKIAEKDFESVEHITHGLKGAALNIGEGGVAQLLIDYNTYMKHGTEPEIVEAYQRRLKETVSDLKVEYSQVA